MLLALPALAIAGQPADRDFRALLDEHWATAVREQVFFRTDPDSWRMNGKLAEFTAQARLRRHQYNETVLERLGAIDKDALDAANRTNYRLFLYERLAEKESYSQPDLLFPIASMFGYHIYFAEAPANMSFLAVGDYEKYLTSLADFPRFNREHIDLMREGVARGYTQNCDAMQRVDESIQTLIVDQAQASSWYGPFRNIPDSIPVATQADLRRRGAALIDKDVIPAYRSLLEYFVKEYMPHCRKEAGIGSLPAGKEYYAWRIRYFTTTDMTPEAIHELGRTELSRIRKEMESIITDLKFDGDFSKFIEYLRTDPRFYAKDVPELLGRAALMAKTAEGELPRFFTLLPRGVYNIKAGPDRGDYYVSSSGDGKTPGTYYVGVAQLDAQPLYTLQALTLHEAVPGHHLQTALALELDVPEFRKTVYHSAFGEGWALYAERLGKEMGLYQDPYSDFGRLTYEAFRACRLVVDTGMHAFGWTRDDAIHFMLENTALSEFEVRNEVDRYISLPAQALAYKVGEYRIRSLRTKAERALGTDFDLRRFHDTVIGSGSVPIAVLEDLVDEWIRLELRNAGS